jgi:hypothetical protein
VCIVLHLAVDKVNTVHYHRLPWSDELRLRQWFQVMKRKPEDINVKYGRVCSNHFTDADYKYEGKFMEDGSFLQVKTNHTKADAVPSIFDFSEYDLSSTDRPTPKNEELARAREIRQQRREQAKVSLIYICTRVYIMYSFSRPSISLIFIFPNGPIHKLCQIK